MKKFLLVSFLLFGSFAFADTKADLENIVEEFLTRGTYVKVNSYKEVTYFYESMLCYIMVKSDENEKYVIWLIYLDGSIDKGLDAKLEILDPTREKIYLDKNGNIITEFSNSKSGYEDTSYNAESKDDD